MEYRQLGRTNLQVSTVSLGTKYLIDQPRQTVIAVVRQAIDQGINYFDLFFAQSRFRDTMAKAFADLDRVQQETRRPTLVERLKAKGLV